MIGHYRKIFRKKQQLPTRICSDCNSASLGHPQQANFGQIQYVHRNLADMWQPCRAVSGQNISVITERAAGVKARIDSELLRARSGGGTGRKQVRRDVPKEPAGRMLPCRKGRCPGLMAPKRSPDRHAREAMQRHRSRCAALPSPGPRCPRADTRCRPAG